MAAPRKLRAVTEGDVPAPEKSIVDAAQGGNQRELLVAMRSRVATAVQDPNCPPRDLAALTRRLQEIGREIEAIDARDLQEAGRGAEVTDGEFDASAV